MIRNVDCPARVLLGADELDVHAYGECWRAPDQRIECKLVCVTLDERDVTLEMLEHASVVEALKMRLCCEYWASGVRGRESVTDGWHGPEGAA